MPAEPTLKEMTPGSENQGAFSKWPSEQRGEHCGGTGTVPTRSSAFSITEASVISLAPPGSLLYEVTIIAVEPFDGLLGHLSPADLVRRRVVPSGLSGFRTLSWDILALYAFVDAFTVESRRLDIHKQNKNKNKKRKWRHMRCQSRCRDVFQAEM